MIKLPEIKEETFSFLRLYLDDYYKIYDLLETDSSQIRVIADGYIIESRDDIKNLESDTIKDLTITAYSVEIKLTRFSARLAVEIHPQDIKKLGLFEKLKSILLETEAVNYDAVIALGYFSSLALVILLFYIFSSVKYSLPLIWISGLMPWLYNKAQSYIRWPPAFLLFSSERKNKKPFFKRNKRYIKRISLVILGSLLTLLGQWILKKYF